MRVQRISTAAAGLWIYQKAGDPTTTDIPTRAVAQVWLNTTTNTVKLWVNKGGTMVGVALA